MIEQVRLEGLRQAVLDLCEVLGIEVTEARALRIEQADADRLKALRAALKYDRRWPI